MATADDKLMTMAEVKTVTDTKMDLDYSKLSAHSGDPNSASIFPIRYGNTTYKIDYDALASAIIKQVTPAGINEFGASSVGTVTNANDTSLYGTKLLNGGSCSNLPSSSAGSYFLVTFMGSYQRASKLSSDGVDSVYERYFNTSWYPWVRVDGMLALTSSDIVNNLTTTVAGSPLDASRGAYLMNLIDSLVSSSLFGS